MPIHDWTRVSAGAFHDFHMGVDRGAPPGIERRFGGNYEPPAGKPLTLAAYAAAGAVTCYVEPTAVGAELIPMPLFLDPVHYINVPLEATCLGAYEGVPQRWKRVIEGVAQR